MVLIFNPSLYKNFTFLQASLGEIRKDKGHQSVNLFVKVNQSKLVIATLTPEKLPQQLLDLAFTTGAEFAHNGTNGSVYLLGYVSDIDLKYPFCATLFFLFVFYII